MKMAARMPSTPASGQADFGARRANDLTALAPPRRPITNSHSITGRQKTSTKIR